MKPQLRLAVVGAGTMGSLHARVIAGHERTQLALVVDPDAAAGRQLAERYESTWTPEFDGTIQVDAVIVAASTRTHHQVGCSIIGAGLPLLLEKPLSDDLREAEDLVARSEVAGTPLMCGFLERFNPGILTAMALLNEPRHITSQRHSPYVARIRTGVATDLLIHDIDLTLRMMGAPPIGVAGSFGYFHPLSEPTSEDVAEAMLTFTDGAIGHLSASRLSQHKVRSFTITELDRLIEVDMLRNTVTIYRHVFGENADDGLSYKQQTIIEIPQLVSTREPLAAELDLLVAIVEGESDIDLERSKILPAHRLVAEIRDAATVSPRVPQKAAV